MAPSWFSNCTLAGGVMTFAPGRKWISKRLRERLFRPGSGEPHLGAPNSDGEWKILPFKISAEYRPMAPKNAPHIIEDTSRYVVRTGKKKRELSNPGAPGQGHRGLEMAQPCTGQKWPPLPGEIGCSADRQAAFAERHSSPSPGKLDRQTFDRSGLIIVHGIEPNSFLYSAKNIL
jgi:hypothetical protein